MATSLDDKTCREIIKKLREGSQPLKNAAAVLSAAGTFPAEFARVNLRNFVFRAWDSLTRKDIEILDEVTKMAGLQHPE
jgi:hypothetical protein